MGAGNYRCFPVTLGHRYPIGAGEYLDVRLAVRYRDIPHPDRSLIHREDVEEDRLIRTFFIFSIIPRPES